MSLLSCPFQFSPLPNPCRYLTQDLLPTGVTQGHRPAAAIRDVRGVQKDVFAWGDPLCIFVEVNVPKNISREHLSIAFSIKDLKGTDLIVSTTHDFECRRLPEKERFSVSFNLTNPLSPVSICWLSQLRIVSIETFTIMSMLRGHTILHPLQTSAFLEFFNLQ